MRPIISLRVRALISLGIVLVALAAYSPALASGPKRTSPVASTPIRETWAEPQLTYGGCGGVDAPVVRADYEQDVVERVNAERLAAGLGPLKRVDPLNRSARYHATDMGQESYFEHDTYDWNGSRYQYTCSTWDRIGAYYTGAAALAENIAAGQGSPEAVMNTWMNSAGHRNNILSPDVWEIGVGYYEGSGYYYRYWVQNFGRRWDVYPVVINREARSTDSMLVSLSIYGTWSEMRLRNDGGAWGAWQPFQSNIAWTLGQGVGDHTVTIELRQGSRTATSSDSIYLTTSPPVATATPPPTRTPTPTRTRDPHAPTPGPMTPRVWLPLAKKS